jgi:DNA-binding phage protein
MRKQTAGERWLAKRMKDPVFAAELEKAREEIDVVDGFIRTLDARRTELGMSKEALAQRVGQNPSALRRLLTSGGNPSLKTMVEIAGAVGLVLKLEAAPETKKAPSKVSRASRRRTKPERKLGATA